MDMVGNIQEQFCGYSLARSPEINVNISAVLSYIKDAPAFYFVGERSSWIVDMEKPSWRYRFSLL